MTKKAKPKQPMLYCSFCQKPHTEVAKLVAGPGAYICDSCIKMAADFAKKSVQGTFSGYDKHETKHLLSLLKPAAKILDNVRDDLQAKIDELRRREVSWAEIGESLGVSRQAAWERFS